MMVKRALRVAFFALDFDRRLAVDNVRSATATARRV
jgi:hypothetical protein